MPPFENDDDDFLVVIVVVMVVRSPFCLGGYKWHQKMKEMKIERDEDGNEKPGLDDVITGESDSRRRANDAIFPIFSQ